VMVRVDEARHDDLARRVDLGSAACVKVRSYSDDLLAFDQNVGLGEFSLDARRGIIVVTWRRE